MISDRDREDGWTSTDLDDGYLLPLGTGPRPPAVETAEHDVNPVCGHRLRAQCVGCGTCTVCDGCYCGEE